MEVDKNDWQAIQNAVNGWEQTGKITRAQADELRADMTIKRTDRQQIAQYFFFIALFCILMAFGALFLNEKLLERLKIYFALNDMVIALATGGMAATWFWYIRRKMHTNPASAAYEINMTLGGLCTLTSLVYLCKPVSGNGSHTLFLSLAVIALGVLGAFMKSRALWLGALAALAGWYWWVTSWLGHDNLFLGMNYPVRFVLLGAGIVNIYLLMKRLQRLQILQMVTYLFGLTLFFLSFWAVSIFGNYNTLVGWQQVRQVHVLAYSIIFGAVTGLVFYLGIKHKDDVARDFAVLFVLINLYTRYFEYFWDAMNKGLFFLVLAVTFGLLGRWLEKKRQTAH